MTRNSSAGGILAPGDAAQLIKLGLVNLPHPPNGSIRIHKRRLNRTSDAVHKKIPLNANIESRPDAFATIPEKLISKATIEYVGYNSDRATEIWSGWANWPSGPIIREIDPSDCNTIEVSFIDWVMRHTGNPLEYDVWGDDDSAWFHLMQQCGIATELQQSIMDPRFKDRRLTGTCIGWLRNTMKLRYEWLQEIQRASAEREKALGNQGISARSQQQSGLASRGVHKLAGPSSVIGSTVLYKAIDEARINDLFDHEGNLDKIQLLLTPLRPTSAEPRACTTSLPTTAWPGNKLRG